MKVITAGRVIRLAFVCTAILQVQSAPPEDSENRQRVTADRISPGTVKPIIERRNVPGDVTNQPTDASKLKVTTTSSKESDENDNVSSTSESTEVTSVRISRSSDNVLRSERQTQFVRKRSAEDESDSTTTEGNETGEDADDETDENNSEEDNGSTEEADNCSDNRRRREAQNDGDRISRGERTKRLARRDSSESDEDDGGFTREAAIVSPVRRRRAPDDKKNSTTSGPIHYDDSIVDPFDDPKEEEVLSRMRRREAETPTATTRRETETSTATTTGGTQLVVVAPADVHVKDIPKALNDTVQTLKDKIDQFEEKAVEGEPTVPTVGVLVGQNTQQDKDTIVHTLSSAQYIVH